MTRSYCQIKAANNSEPTLSYTPLNREFTELFSYSYWTSYDNLPNKLDATADRNDK